MEDYEKAYECRLLDIEALLATNPKRTMTAAHIGGVAIECRLKSMIIDYHCIAEWGALSSRPKDPRTSQPIERTSHALFAAVKMMDVLCKKAKADKNFIKHLSAINHPIGASEIDFIALRYSSNDLNPVSLANWKRSFSYVQGWLEKNGKLL